jgi:predicted type IV restriction endonuclease
MSLEKHIEDIRLSIKAGRFINEASVSQGIVLRLLHALSWPAYDTQTVCPQIFIARAAG